MSTNGWMHKENGIHIMEYYSVLKRKEILLRATTQVDIMINESSQLQKICKVVTLTEAESRMVVAKD